MMFGFLTQIGARPIVRQHADAAGGPAENPFNSNAQVGQIVAPGCHECECEKIFEQVMQRVLRVRDTCGHSVCNVRTYPAFRRRNLAISADYARIYLAVNGEAKRLKFAGAAAFGSTHIGLAMDLAARTLDAWGNGKGEGEPDLIISDDTHVFPDTDVWPFDLQEAVSRALTGVGYEDTRTGLRRLIYGNLAIYMDLGAVLWFCLLHEQQFNFFRDGRVEEFMECFERFVTYVRDNHADDHDVYADGGSFGSDEEGWLRKGLRALAHGDVKGSLSIIDHEQRTILEKFMYDAAERGLVKSIPPEELGTDDEFADFMNALEKVQWHSGVGPDPRFNGIRAIFSANTDVRLLCEAVIGYGPQHFNVFRDQPLINAFDTRRYGDDFTDPDVRTPWFKDVVDQFVACENNNFNWPPLERTSPFRSYVFKSDRSFHDMSLGPPDLQAILYSDLGRIRGAG